jgi:hypothetical protein
MQTIYVLLYLQPCILPDAVSLWIQQRNGIKLCANLGKNVTETLAMISQVFGGEIISRTRAFEWRVKTHGETGAQRSHEHAHHFL